MLLVDENLLLVKSLARWLARFGCDVSAAVTCSDAAASVGPFDCGVFDVELGAADGVALADSLLSAGTVSTVTFFCATNDGRVLRRAAELGPVVFKDARMLELIKTVRTQIQRARSAP